MGEIVNLRQVRKQRERVAETEHAAEMRARHGRTSAEKAADRLAAERLRRAQEGARLPSEPTRNETEEH